MIKSISISCSNCGHRSRRFRVDNQRAGQIAYRIVGAGWDSYGSAFYCPKCARTWHQRNSKSRPLFGPAHTRELVYQRILTMRDVMGGEMA